MESQRSLGGAGGVGLCEDGLWDGGTGSVGGGSGGASSSCGVSLSSLLLSGRARSTSSGGSNGGCSGTELSCVLGGFVVQRGKIDSSNMTSGDTTILRDDGFHSLYLVLGKFGPVQYSVPECSPNISCK